MTLIVGFNFEQNPTEGQALQCLHSSVPYEHIASATHVNPSLILTNGYERHKQKWTIRFASIVFVFSCVLVQTPRIQ